MDITPLISADRQVIQGYGPGTFRVSGKSFNSAVIVFPDRVIPWGFHGDIAALSPHDFRTVLADDAGIDVVLLGCGKTMAFVPPALRQALKGNGIALEPMDSGAACRTYNVLMAEGRRVAAALLPV